MINNSDSPQPFQPRKSPSSKFNSKGSKLSEKTGQLSLMAKLAQKQSQSQFLPTGTGNEFKATKEEKEGKKKYYDLALSVTVPRPKSLKEKDFGLDDLRRTWRKIYKYVVGYASRNINSVKITRVYSRNPGWEPKTQSSTREWVENNFHNRPKYFTRVKGLGRWHLHSMISFSAGITEKERRKMKKHINKIIGSKSQRAVDFAPVRCRSAWLTYMGQNIKDTKRNRSKVRLVAIPIKRKSNTSLSDNK